MRGAAFLIAAGLALAARPAAAQSTTVPAGGSFTFSGDITLSGTDSFVAGAAGGARCTIDGAQHALQTAAGWTGRIVISACDITNLGTADLDAINVDAGAGAVFDVENTTFHVSGQIEIKSFADITFLFRANTIATDSVVHVERELGDSRPVFHFYGDGGASQKLFQGNRILRSWMFIEDGNNWLIGGATPAEGNVLVGERSGMQLDGVGMVVRGNYVHITGVLANMNQIANIYATGHDDAFVMEHNVIRGGNWLVRTFSGGDLRYNLLGDPYAIAWVLTSPDAKARIHHNVMVRNNKLMETFYEVDGVSLVNTSAEHSTSVYNNTLDGSGYCYDIVGRAISMDSGAFMASLRSNVFFNLPSDWGDNTALVGPGQTGPPEFKRALKGDPGPAALDYADYNLFYNPKAKQMDNYGVSVPGLTERTSPGFALHDAPAMGAKDAQVDPQFTGPLPTVFPFSDDDLIAGNVNVCQILAFYRTLYTPKSTSPVIDMGDPADGTGVDIGAVGAGVEDPADQFGKLCSAADSALPAPPTVQTECPQPIVPGGGSGTGGSGPPPGHGFVCVCDAAAGDRFAPPLAVLALVALYAALLRPRRRRARSLGR